MKWFIVLLFLCSSFFLFIAILQLLFLHDKRLDKRMQRYLSIDSSKQALSRKKFNLLVQLRLYKKTVRERVLTKSRNERLALMLHRAGVPIKPEEYVLFQWICSALGGGFLFLFLAKPFFLIFGAIVCYFLPGWWVKRKQRLRVKGFNDALPDMISTSIGSLRAGFSFPQALKTVVDESTGPMKEEMETVLREMQYGSSMEESLSELKDRMPSEDLDLMIQAIIIQRQVGGNLATILQTIVETIRDRTRIQGQIMTLTAQGRLSGLIIGLLPIVLGFILYLIQPDYIGSLFVHPVGMMMVGGGFISGTIGFVLIRKVTTIEV